MDLWSPRSLKDLCINVLAKRTDILWTGRKRPLVCGLKGVEWKDPEVFLNSDIADKLLETLSYEKNFDDSILSTFTNDHVHLQRVSLFFNTVTGCGLKVLKDHKLFSLHIATSPFDVDIVCKVLKIIGNNSFESLQHLAFWWNCRRIPDPKSFRGLLPEDDDFLQQTLKQTVVETLSRFNCLRSLDIRGTNLTDTNLAMLGKSLPHVENLNLSWNFKITDISPLKNCQKTLKSLSLGELYRLAPELMLATFVTLSGLTFLDMSLRVKGSPSGLRNAFTVKTLLQMPDILPNLVCLDLSGRIVNSEQALRQFLDAHQSLQMLMLCGSAACEFQSLQDFRPRLTVGGNATLEQYTAALQYYNRRAKHRPIPGYENCRQMIVDELLCDLNKASKPFPPCLDDQLVQELLDSIPTCLNFLSDDSLWDSVLWCLMNIAVLLEKGIIPNLEPDTKPRLLLLCHRTVQQYIEASVGYDQKYSVLRVKFVRISDACMTARKLLKSLGEPESPHW